MKNPNDGKLKSLIQLGSSLNNLLPLIDRLPSYYRNRDIASRYNLYRKEVKKLVDDTDFNQLIPSPVWVFRPLLHIPIIIILVAVILISLYPFSVSLGGYLILIVFGSVILFFLLMAIGVIDRYEGNHIFLASTVEQVGHRTILLLQVVQDYIRGNYPSYAYSIKSNVDEIDRKIEDLEEANRQLKRSLQSKTRELNKLTPVQPEVFFVNPKRLKELRKIQSQYFDFAKLVELCDELNECYSKECYLAVAMITRSILDHVPPIFNCNSFTEVANNYSGGGKSFRQSMQHLQNSSRKIADAHLHSQIRRQETLPNQTQVDFSNDLDVLFGEIVRILK